MTAVPNFYAKARSEVASMLGYDLDNLSAEQATRLDVATALRVLLDNQTGKLLRGESLDAREMLTVSEALSRLLPPLREPPADTNRIDPREHLLQMYLGMRERGALAGEGYDGLVLENERLSAEIEQLKARLAGKTSEHSDIPTMVERVPAPAANVVPLSRPNPPAVPAYDYNTQRGWRDHVLPDGSIV